VYGDGEADSQQEIDFWNDCHQVTDELKKCDPNMTPSQQWKDVWRSCTAGNRLKPAVKALPADRRQMTAEKQHLTAEKQHLTAEQMSVTVEHVRTGLDHV
jgi:uncharacterized protein (DUF3084 family)